MGNKTTNRKNTSYHNLIPSKLFFFAWFVVLLLLSFSCFFFFFFHSLILTSAFFHQPSAAPRVNVPPVTPGESVVSPLHLSILLSLLQLCLSLYFPSSTGGILSVICPPPYLPFSPLSSTNKCASLFCSLFMLCIKLLLHKFATTVCEGTCCWRYSSCLSLLSLYIFCFWIVNDLLLHRLLLI